MSPRKRVLRKVLDQPIINGVNPYGQESVKLNLEPVNLLYEEYDYTYGDTYTKLCNELGICSNCGFEQKRQRGKNCNQEIFQT